MARTDQKAGFALDEDRLRNLPHGILGRLIPLLWWIRKTFFSKPKPANLGVLVERPLDEITTILGRNHFEPGWELSYNYHNEILNLRRVEYDPSVLPGCEWFQVHIRGYQYDETRLELAAHFETEPTEHPDMHINEIGIDVERGNVALMDTYLMTWGCHTSTRILTTAPKGPSRPWIPFPNSSGITDLDRRLPRIP